MKDIMTEDFQNAVDNILVRNRSILDVMSKFDTSAARVNRAIVKSVTHCGCMQINASKQDYPEHASIEDIRLYADSHTSGELCEKCRDIVEKEIGATMFYLASLCNELDVSMYDVLLQERQRLGTLGKFNLR
ncbi:MAG: DUF1573 domain-containing protein [Christensenellales bacterium]|jgi:hypothetical protein